MGTIAVSMLVSQSDQKSQKTEVAYLIGAPPEQAGLSPMIIACSRMATLPKLTARDEFALFVGFFDTGLLDASKLSVSVFTLIIPFTPVSPAATHGDEDVLGDEFMFNVDGRWIDCLIKLLLFMLWYFTRVVCYYNPREQIGLEHVFY